MQIVTPIIEQGEGANRKTILVLLDWENTFDKVSHEGIFLALVDKSNEYIISTPNGCVKSNNCKRLNREDAADPALVAAVVGKPWKLTPSAA